VARPEPLIRFETELGRQMQADFATIRRGKNRLAVFIATLGWSRATFVAFVTDERMETLLGCHKRAFYFFGGIPAKCSTTTCDGGDRTGSLRTRAASLYPHLSRLRASSWLRAAALPALSNLDQGQGRAFIRYLRASFYVPLASQLSREGLKVDRETANARVGTWLREVANARVHATTGEIPLVRLEQETCRGQSPAEFDPAHSRHPDVQ
jgi:transposase